MPFQVSKPKFAATIAMIDGCNEIPKPLKPHAVHFEHQYQGRKQIKARFTVNPSEVFRLEHEYLQLSSVHFAISQH